MYRAISVVFVLMIACVTCLSGPATEPAAPATQPGVVELPHAGISLALPADFEPRTPEEPFDALRAVQETDGKAQIAVTLSVYPVGTNVTSESYAKAMYDEMRKNLNIRYLELKTETRLAIDQVPSMAHVLTYTFRGERFAAVRVHTMREIKDTPIRLCYVLTIESPAERQGKIQPVLESIARSMRFTPLRHGSELPLGTLLRPMTDGKLGYSMRVPLGWYAIQGPAGIEMAQTDYLAAGVAMPTATLTAKKELAKTAAETVARKDLLDVRDAAATSGVKIDVISEGPSSLGGLVAYQYVVKQYLSAATTQSDKETPTIVVAHRTAVRPPDRADENATAYKLIVIAKTSDAGAVSAMLDRLAQGFAQVEFSRTFKPQLSMPATAPVEKPKP
jgi:hypothetical protein